MYALLKQDQEWSHRAVAPLFNTFWNVTRCDDATINELVAKRIESSECTKSKDRNASPFIFELNSVRWKKENFQRFIFFVDAIETIVVHISIDSIRWIIFSPKTTGESFVSLWEISHQTEWRFVDERHWNCHRRGEGCRVLENVKFVRLESFGRLRNFHGVVAKWKCFFSLSLLFLISSVFVCVDAIELMKDTRRLWCFAFIWIFLHLFLSLL